MTKKIFIICFLIIVSQFTLFAQPPCGTNDAPGNTCIQATPMCNLDGYCGTTSSSYTVDSWNSPCGLFNWFNCGLSGEFCGSIENNSFLSFVASATSISFDVWVYNSSLGYGIQIMIFSAAGNCSGNVTRYYCNGSMAPSPNPQNVSASGLTVGQTYYIMIDGNAGDVADYTFAANSGILTPLDFSTGPTTSICPGESVTVTATGGNGNYTWSSPSTGLSATTGATVTITPPSSPGTYTYTATTGGGTSLCPSSNTYTLTITVGSCGCTLTAANSNASFCSNTGGTVNLTSTATAGSGYSWTGPGGFTSNQQNPANVTVPTTAGTYTYNVQATENNRLCYASTSIVVNDVPVANAGQNQILDCINPVTTFTGSSSTPGGIYLWTGPGIVSGGTTLTPTINVPGTYTLLVTNPITGCFSTSTVNATLNTGTFTVSAGNDQVLDCINTSVSLIATSSESNVNYLWSGPSIVSGGNTSTVIVDGPGAYTVTVTNLVNGCTETSSVNVTEDIVIPVSTFLQDTLIGCRGLQVRFTPANNNQNTRYLWDFGDGKTSAVGNAINRYSNVGCFDVKLTVTDLTNGCSSTTQHSDQICVFEIPSASFSANPQSLLPNVGETLVTLTNNSIGGTDYLWVFDDGTQTITEDATFDFKDYEPGDYPIKLVVSNQNICFDSITVLIRLTNEVIFYVPNSFTPDGDEHNQFFKPIITSGIDIFNFTFQIYNRWGEMVWESMDASVGWNGQYNGKGAQDGVYTWVMKYKTIEKDNRVEVQGQVNLIR